MEKIYSRKNKLLMHTKNLGRDRKYRLEHGEFLCDGAKLLEEAVCNRAEIVNVLTSDILKIDIPKDVCIFEVESDLLMSISPLKNAQSIVFTCKIPSQEDADYSRGTHILLDGVQDPGNVGTILRSAAAFGIQSIILTEDCADPYNPKAIRASMGAIFKQKISYAGISQLRSMGARIIGTGKDAGYTTIRKAKLSNSIIVLGSEGQGISDEVKSVCEGFVTIPITPGCESLNVAIAASIIMYEAGKP